MAKKALCVGINDYPFNDSDLKGCVNDARAWTDLLITHFDFTTVRLLLDEAATKANILAGLVELLQDAQSGDVLVYSYSGHGTYVADTSGDEPLYDEAQCPYDSDANLIFDDELRQIFGALPDGVHLTVISDSCFSGTVTRVLLDEDSPQDETSDDRRVRFLSPEFRGKAAEKKPLEIKAEAAAPYPESGMKEILLSGCDDDEYSYDALIKGDYHGAMTYYAIEVIREAGYLISYRQLFDELLFRLDDANYPQHPQLEGQDVNKELQLFT